MHYVTIPNTSIKIGPGEPLTFMTGPCVIESEEHTLRTAERLKRLFHGRRSKFVFKSSYDKANRSSINSFRGPGLQEGLRILEKVKKEFDVPVISDIHSPEEARAAAGVIDILQIPAFLCRQTDLVVAVAETGSPINIKKGQFVSPWDMGNVVEKARSTGNNQILLCDRGTCFGYNNLVTDFRSIPVMQGFGCPVVFDASHSVQLPGGLGSKSGGQREFIPTLAKAAVAAGCDAIFIESHPDPANAMSDAATVWPIDQLEKLLDVLEQLHEVVKK